MFEDTREQVEHAARIAFQGLRDTVAAGEAAFVEARVQDFEEREARAYEFRRSERERRDQDLAGLRLKLTGGAA